MVICVAGFGWAVSFSIEPSAFVFPTSIHFHTGLVEDEVLDTQYIALGVDFLGWHEPFYGGVASYAVATAWCVAHTPSFFIAGGAQVVEFLSPQVRVGAWVYKWNDQHLHTLGRSPRFSVARVSKTTSSGAG